MSCSTPIALLIYHRPDLTRLVFEAIRKAKPKILLVIADGPRGKEDNELCTLTRAVIEHIDWKCEVLTNFSDINLGCRQRVSSGLDWVFSEVEEAIILEDDCLPSPSFFYFCQTLLERYRHDERVMHIGGSNFQLGNNQTDYSYYFSKYPRIWGWASWRRAWKYYDIKIKGWPEFHATRMADYIFHDNYERKYWTDILDAIYTDELFRVVDTWDYQWNYACWSQNGLSITPSVNLVSNLGCGRIDSTNTHLPVNEDPRAELPVCDIWDIKHPPFIIKNEDADNYEFDYVIGGQKMRENDRFISKSRKKISSAKRKIKNWFFSAGKSVNV